MQPLQRARRSGRASERTYERQARLVGLVCAVVALGVFLWGAGRPAYWLDESFTVDAATRSWGDLLALLAVRDAPNGPYYGLMKPWAAVSTEEGWIRLPSVLAMAGTAGLVGHLVARRAGAAGGLGGGLLLVMLPAVSRYGQEARPYALALLALMVAATAWSALERPPRGDRAWRWGTCFSLAAAFAVTMNVMAGVIVLAQVVARTLDVRAGWRSRTLRMWTWAVLGAAIALPQVLHVATAGAIGVANAPPPGWAAIGAASGYPLHPPAATVVVVVLAAAGVLGPRDAEVRRIVLLGVCWVAVGSAFLVVGALVQPSLAVGRYWLLTTPGWAILAGVGVSVTARALVAMTGRARSRAVAVVLPLTVVAVVGLDGQVAMRSSDGHEGQDPRPSLARMSSPAFAGLPIVGVPDVVRPSVVSYAPGLLSRMPFVRDPRPSGQLVVPDTDPLPGTSPLSASEEVAIVGMGRPRSVRARTGVHPAIRAWGPYEVVEEVEEAGWTVLRIRREEGSSAQ